MLPQIGIPSRSAGDQGVHIGRNPANGATGRWWRYVTMHVRVRDLDGRIASVRFAPRQELEKNDAGAVDIGSCVRVPGHHKLRWQIGHGADEQPLGSGVGL
jgi:hypothetical protein